MNMILEFQIDFLICTNTKQFIISRKATSAIKYTPNIYIYWEAMVFSSDLRAEWVMVLRVWIAFW